MNRPDCPRGHTGQMFLEYDEYGLIWHCLSCGYSYYADPKKRAAFESLSKMPVSTAAQVDKRSYQREKSTLVVT